MYIFCRVTGSLFPANVRAIMKSSREIYYLAYQGLSLNGIEESLRFMYPNARIKAVDPTDLVFILKYQKVDLLVFPGNNTEHSPYPQLLPPDTLAVLYDSIAENGLGLLTFCAASYYMMDSIEYETREGEIKRKNGAGFIKGLAVMAFHEKTRGRGKTGQILDDYVEARLNIPDLKSSEMHLLNINGPALITSFTESSLCDKFAFYYELEDWHCAALTKKIGKGFVCALGVHPELSARNSSANYQDKFPNHERDRFKFLKLLKVKLENARYKNEQNHPSASPPPSLYPDLCG